MDLNEIQQVWDSQDDHPTREIDERLLAEQIKSKGRFFERLVNLTEFFAIGVLLFITAMFVRDPILQGHDLILILPGIGSLLAAIFVISGRIMRKRREIKFDDSIKGIVEKSIMRIDYQIARMRNFVWWFATPMAFGLLIGVFIVDESKRYLFYWCFIPLFLLSIGLCFWQVQREIRNKLLPERDALRNILNGLD